MKNFLGQEIDSTDTALHFEWFGATMNVLRGKPFTNADGVPNCRKYVGTVTLNGGDGYSICLAHKLGEPMFINLTDVSLSFGEVQSIMAEYNGRVSPKDAMKVVIIAIATERYISYDAAITYIYKNKIPCVAEILI